VCLLRPLKRSILGLRKYDGGEKSADRLESRHMYKGEGMNDSRFLVENNLFKAYFILIRYLKLR